MTNLLPSNQRMLIKLQMLTPLWTGGVEIGMMDRIHETGILGSLRWWYEVIMRGLGSDVCDPTADNSQQRCQFDTEAYQATLHREGNKDSAIQQGLRNVCPVCRLFGTTGWRRRFRLVVDSVNLTETWPGESLNIKPPDRNRGWYLPAGQMGMFTVGIMADDEAKSRLLALLRFMEKWGTIGAKPQLGYGLFKMIGIENPPQQPYNWSGSTEQTGQERREAYPDLRIFTFFALSFIPARDDWWRDVPGIGGVARDNRHQAKVNKLLHHHIMPTTPALKDVLRYGVHWSSGSLPHQFFGTLRGNERSRSKIALSWAYQQPTSQSWQIRGWAYPPQVGKSQQQEVQQRLQDILGKPESWLRALNIRYRSAEITLTPTPTFFQPRTSAQVQQFVNGVSEPKVQA